MNLTTSTLKTEFIKREYKLNSKELPERGTNFNNNEITLEEPISDFLSNLETKIYLIDTVKNVVLKNLSVEYIIPNKDINNLQFIYSNPFLNHSVDLVRLNWTSNIQVKDLDLFNAGRHPISIENSFNCYMSDLDIDGSWNKGKQGFGYLKISKSHFCNLENLKVKNIRHIVLQWGASYNTINELYTEVDINFHGGYSHNNTISNITFNLSKLHPWKNIFRTPTNAHWAAPDGPNNVVL